ncbi:MAG: DNA polymerase I [candidate division KSB1 bacterium]|nr:DNA polymerase I [candidate division KSB1 bacterium]MDZ7273257.1 DNA polymerase I [candidate division KSB1 bacterium]MDZ7285359.1 DNA polymerase I [candidate division KSB1 bacterium]MDZ7298391.1 DNA polymerase I [candidate division KSB1 bacterium]MDZ7306469.1 DNA polymerase I [candidate division KSB1 bacterium]
MTSSSKPPGSGRLFLIDGHALAYRSHFAFIKNPLTNSRGEPTSAVFGFVRTLLQLLDEQKPEYLAVVFDTPEPTFRHQAFPAYKATRQRMPAELSGQIPHIRAFSEALGANLVELPGFEADDVMGTLARQMAQAGVQVFLCTGDKDLMQLVDDHIFIYYTGRNNEAHILDRAGVREKFGVAPEQMIDYLALVGDNSDNVPGVPKVGEKTALELLDQFGTLENLLAHTDQVKRPHIRENLRVHAEQARLSRRLVTIETQVPLSLTLEDLRYRGVDAARAAALCRALEFHSLIPRFVESAAPTVTTYHLVDTPAAVQRLVGQLEQAAIFAFDTETTAADPLRAELVGLSFSWREGEGWYVPVAPSPTGRLDDFFLQEPDGRCQFSLKRVLGPLLEDARHPKCGQNTKYDLLVMKRYGVTVRGVVHDTMVASYVLNPAQRQHNLDALCLEHFNYRKIPTQALIGSGKKQKSMRAVPVAEVAKYAGEDADFTLRLYHLFEKKLRAAGLHDLFDRIEMPLVEVLLTMEWHGVGLDVEYLAGMSRELEGMLAALMAEIYAAAGEPFNLNSPQQLGRILFERLKLPRKRRTKTGYSTDAEVLEELSQYHELPRKIIEYRELAKLKSTYVDSLPQLVNPATGRLHTSFNQTVAATGRLSSSDPNLQNIPIRTEIGRRIRRAFIAPEPGWLLLDADYSQIELRIMAHLSKDQAMIAAFRREEDIHAATASRVFNVPPAAMTPELRRRAKEINFGILYGMGAYGLSRRLGISVEEAQHFITSYFVQYPGVNEFIMGTIAEARRKGYVTTLLNRRRDLPDLNSDNPRVAETAERMAINTPIQGTAADLIKIAMINLHRRLAREGLQARMILQVHDELVFEAPEAEITPLRQIVIEEMSGAVQLDVPVKIEVGVGRNWLEAH